MPDPLEHLRLPAIPVDPRAEFAASLLARIRNQPTGMPGVTVRYFVDDMDAAVGFYADLLDFTVGLRPSPAFAMLYRGELRLMLSLPGGHHTLPDGTVPEPGGWNRISLEVADLDTTVTELRARGARFRTEITLGVGVRQALVVDPAGNLIELFEQLAGDRLPV